MYQTETVFLSFSRLLLMECYMFQVKLILSDKFYFFYDKMFMLCILFQFFIIKFFSPAGLLDNWYQLFIRLVEMLLEIFLESQISRPGEIVLRYFLGIFYYFKRTIIYKLLRFCLNFKSIIKV